VLGSATGPVTEMIQDGVNGLLADFFDADGFAAKALAVLKDPQAYRPLGRAAEAMIADRYSLEKILPRMVKLYEQTVEAGAGRHEVAMAGTQSLGNATPFHG
jgi:glycosyltransferase involved in cell wall biosynthesis